MTDDDFWGSFQREKPAILGAILDTLQKAMQILPSLKLEKLARMAEAYKEMVAIAIALGISQEEFQEIFRANKDKLEASYVQNNPFIELVVNYVERKKRVDAPGQQVYDELYESKGKGFQSFPESASALSKKLNLERGTLEDVGISFSRHKRGNANYIRLEKIPQSQMTRKQKDTAKLLASMDE